MNKSARQSPAFPAIPLFDLYGESAGQAQPDFTHVEDIHERSARNGWEIRPHRHAHIIQILCMTSGRAETRMDAHNAIHDGACVMLIPPGVVHGFRFRPDTQGMVFSIAMDFLAHHDNGQFRSIVNALLDSARIIPLARDDRDLAMLVSWLQAIRREQESTHADSHLAVSALAELVMVTLKRILQTQSLEQVFADGAATLVRQYRDLLEQLYREQPQIKAFAADLHVSVSTLNRACRQVSGSTAKKLLMQRLHMEARRRLIYTRETLDQIAWDLGYRDAAYFSRVFRQMEGVSPGAFRQDPGRQWGRGYAVAPAR
jgi:AraC family transcriptional activator of pobA